MEDLTYLGKRVIFFNKGLFLFLLSLMMMIVIIAKFFGNPMMMANNSMAQSIGFLTLIIMTMIISAIVIILFCISNIYLLLWIFRLTKNLRKKAKTVLSPWVSVVILMICYVNIFALFGIMKNLAHVQEKLIQEFCIISKPFPHRYIITWFVSTLACIVSLYNSSSSIFLMLSICFATISVYCMIRVMESFIEHYNLLYKYEQDQIFQKKVEETIREREIEKLAQELQKANY